MCRLVSYLGILAPTAVASVPVAARDWESVAPGRASMSGRKAPEARLCARTAQAQVQK